MPPTCKARSARSAAAAEAAGSGTCVALLTCDLWAATMRTRTLPRETSLIRNCCHRVFWRCQHDNASEYQLEKPMGCMSKVKRLAPAHAHAENVSNGSYNVRVHVYYEKPICLSTRNDMAMAMPCIVFSAELQPLHLQPAVLFGARCLTACGQCSITHLQRCTRS
jgi:hypothetical protein